MTEQKNHKNQKTTTQSILSRPEDRGLKFYLIELVAVFIAAIIIWPVFDIIYNAVFTHSEFVYDVHQYIIQPLIFAVIFAIVSYLVDLIWAKIKKSKTKSK